MGKTPHKAMTAYEKLYKTNEDSHTVFDKSGYSSTSVTAWKIVLYAIQQKL